MATTFLGKPEEKLGRQEPLPTYLQDEAAMSRGSTTFTGSHSR